jgi:hypothetical protein
MEPGATRNERRRARVEAAALAALAALPLLPYFLALARAPIPRFAIEGDYAALELAARLVPTGKTLLGPYSRFGFSHPGPLYFYVMAPIYALYGGTSTGIFAAAASVNAAAAMVSAAAVRLATTRVHALAVTVVLVAWLGAYGNACALPWNPLVVVLPLVAFLVLAALTARGALWLAPPAVFFGAFVAETHLATIPTVLGVSLAALAVVIVRARRGQRLTREDKRALLIALAVLFAALAPPLLEQVLAREGNLTKLARFFAHRPEPLKPLGEALHNWTFATSWLPDRILERSLFVEGDTAVMRSDPVPPALSATALRSTVALLLASALAAGIALRRRDTASLSLLGAGALASLLAVLALRAVIGTNFIYLVYWTTAGSTLLWMGVGAALASGAAELAARARPSIARPLTALALGFVLATSAASASLQRGWLARNTLGPQVSAPMREVYLALAARVAKTGETPVIHAQGAWYIACNFLLELSKDGLPAAIDERDRWLFGRQTPTPEGLARPLHVYIRTGVFKLENAACLESLAASGGIEVMLSPVDTPTCDQRSPRSP